MYLLAREIGAGEFPNGFPLHELVAASEKLSCGSIENAVRSTLTDRFLAKMRQDLDLDGNGKMDPDAFLKTLALEVPVSDKELGELRDWTRNLPEFASLKKRRDPPAPPEEGDEKDAKGKKKGK